MTAIACCTRSPAPRFPQTILADASSTVASVKQAQTALQEHVFKTQVPQCPACCEADSSAFAAAPSFTRSPRQNSVEAAEAEIRALLARCEAQYYSSQYR